MYSAYTGNVSALQIHTFRFTNNDKGRIYISSYRLRTRNKTACYRKMGTEGGWTQQHHSIRSSCLLHLMIKLVSFRCLLYFHLGLV